MLRTRIFADLIRVHPRCEASATIRVQIKYGSIVAAMSSAEAGSCYRWIPVPQSRELPEHMKRSNILTFIRMHFCVYNIQHPHFIIIHCKNDIVVPM
jgi:hypothetical protein